MMIVPIIVIGLIIWAVIYFARQTNNQRSSTGESAMEILKKRYALGEISKEEFEERKRNLVY